MLLGSFLKKKSKEKIMPNIPIVIPEEMVKNTETKEECFKNPL